LPLAAGARRAGAWHGAALVGVFGTCPHRVRHLFVAAGNLWKEPYREPAVSLETRPLSDGGWRRIEVTTGEITHGGWWRAFGEQVHLESEYGNANSKIDGQPPESLAAELFWALIEHHSRGAGTSNGNT
jgi:hypothetical protein